jgi:putative ATP-grasp target RiPP
MRPYPETVVLPAARLTLDPATQTGRWKGTGVTTMDRHKRSETSNETKTQTSSDGNMDEGSDQSGDAD